MKAALFAVPLVVVVALVGLLLQGLRLDPREVDSPLVGKPAPAFALPALGGGAQITERDLQAEVSLLNVWASWCVSCRAEHEVLIALAAQEPQLAIYGLNYKDTPADAQAWLARLGNPYRASAMDARGQVGIDWGVYGVPETFLIDRQGIIRAKRIGPLTWDYVRDELLPLIRELRS